VGGSIDSIPAATAITTCIGLERDSRTGARARSRTAIGYNQLLTTHQQLRAGSPTAARKFVKALMASRAFVGHRSRLRAMYHKIRC